MFSNGLSNKGTLCLLNHLPYAFLFVCLFLIEDSHNTWFSHATWTEMYICPRLSELPSHSSKLSQGPRFEFLSLYICFFNLCNLWNRSGRLQMGAFVLAASEQQETPVCQVEVCCTTHPVPREPRPGQQGSCRMDSVCLYFLNCTRRPFNNGLWVAQQRWAEVKYKQTRMHTHMYVHGCGKTDLLEEYWVVFTLTIESQKLLSAK